MRLVIQRVSSASVSVAGQLVSSISHGLCILVGIAHDDTEKDDIDPLSVPFQFIPCVRKLLDIKLWADPLSNKPWAKSLRDMDGEVLCVSQFTLHARLSKGTKPDFSRAKKSSDGAQDMYDTFVRKVRERYGVVGAERVKDGVFGAMMSVNIVNDGPVTIVLDSKKTDTVDGALGAIPALDHPAVEGGAQAGRARGE
ncbi:D-tyrosyl-tRNA(Tyr) deacylase [Gonapodya sp. JEL0774]|nr:D-tyrosyl-tRNA(Tyr) deacylase [Gonapodya sp. JEL0774]